MTVRRVYCPNCDRQVSAADINIAAMTGLCITCDHIFAIPALSTGFAADLPEPARPSGVKIEFSTAGQLLITRTWFQSMFIFMLFFCIAWDGFLIFWYTMAVVDPAEGGMRLMTLFFPICHVAVGVGLTYYTIAGFFNRSEIFLNHNGLHVRHRPIPWRGNRDLAREEIHGIEVDHSASPNTDQTSPQQMAVSVHHTEGQQIILLNQIPCRDAEFIAWHLADALDVKLTMAHNQR